MQGEIRKSDRRAAVKLSNQHATRDIYGAPTTNVFFLKKTLNNNSQRFRYMIVLYQQG